MSLMISLVKSVVMYHLLLVGFFDAVMARNHFLRKTLDRLRKFVHLKIKDFQCSDCNKAFYAKCTLDKHRNSVHLNIRDLQCNDCDKTFSDKWTLGQHRKSIHLKVKDVYAVIAIMRFPSKGS